MTRRLRALLSLLSAAVAWAVVALPAAATEGAEAAEAGAGQWDGLIATAIAGLVLGAVAFAMSDPGGIPKADAHH